MEGKLPLKVLTNGTERVLDGLGRVLGRGFIGRLVFVSTFDALNSLVKYYYITRDLKTLDNEFNFLMGLRREGLSPDVETKIAKRLDTINLFIIAGIRTGDDLVREPKHHSFETLMTQFRREKDSSILGPSEMVELFDRHKKISTMPSEQSMIKPRKDNRSVFEEFDGSF